MQDCIKTSLKYIEDNLQTIITADELAGMAGYSVWYFCRVFSQAVGSPVNAYICKRRIDRAMCEISDGQKAVDVVLRYGFDTYAGFYKAFVRLNGHYLTFASKMNNGVWGCRKNFLKIIPKTLVLFSKNCPSS